jgi:hypothetical protein
MGFDAGIQMLLDLPEGREGKGNVAERPPLQDREPYLD